MTQKSPASEHTFVAPITAIGTQGNSWKVEFDWKLPGSKFPFVLYVQDGYAIDDFHVGDQTRVVIKRGVLKEGKSGQYASDYFYDLESIVETDGSSTPPTAATSKDPAPRGNGSYEYHTAPETNRIAALNASIQWLGQRVRAAAEQEEEEYTEQEPVALARAFLRFIEGQAAAAEVPGEPPEAENATQAPRGSMCVRHNKMRARLPDGKIGHPMAGGAMCYET